MFYRYSLDFISDLQYDPPENFWCLDRLSTLKLDTTFENNLCKIGDYNQIKDKRGFVDSRFYKGELCNTSNISHRFVRCISVIVHIPYIIAISTVQ